jgi:hypothetical protein
VSGEPKYRWCHPAEWLLDRIDNEWTRDQIQDAFRSLLTSGCVTGDDIQNVFQSDMDADGYFAPEDSEES